MRVSLSIYNVAAKELADLCVATEDAGFAGVWLGEHVVLPHGYATEHPTSGGGHAPMGGRPIIDPATELVDPWVGLAAAASVTRALRLGTGIYLLALRHPLATARAAVSLHEVSTGRLDFGVGAGWLREEFDALGVAFGSRGRRFDECLTIFRRACAGGPFSFDGEFYSFDTVQVTARPAPIPLVLGGNSDVAMRRAVRLADAWICSGIPTFDEAIALKRRIEAVADQLGREAPLPLHFRVPGCDPAVVPRYAEAGIDNLILFTDEIFRDRPVSAARDVLGGFTAHALTDTS